MHTRDRSRRTLLIWGSFLVALLAPRPGRALPVKVVTTLAAYGSIAELVGGERVEVQSISRSDEDAHFVKPKPSFALMLKDADLFVTTGLDLELWGPVLVDKSGNRAIRDGQPGFVSASQGVPLLEVPAVADRSQGDVHIHGNPHIFTSPLNAKIIAANIAAGLRRVDPGGAATYAANLDRFRRRIDEALYGEELVKLLGAETLDPLALQGRLLPFLEQQQYQGRPLRERLGGWMSSALPFRGKQIVAYHRDWIYFADLFGLEIAGYVENKPGIPPSARHVHELVELISGQGIRVLLATSYYSSQQVQAIAERTGCRALRVPLGPGTEGIPDYFAFIDHLVSRLAEAFGT